MIIENSSFDEAVIYASRAAARLARDATHDNVAETIAEACWLPRQLRNLILAEIRLRDRKLSEVLLSQSTFMW